MPMGRGSKVLTETASEGSYLDDVRDGRFVEKDANGQVTSTGHYESGKRFNDQ